MTLTRIALQDLRLRKGRTAFLLLTFCLVTAVIAGLQALAADLRGDLQQSLNRYGANIIITPRSEHLSLSYNGVPVPGVNYNVKPLSKNILETIKQDSLSSGIQVIAPKVIGKVQGPDIPLLVVGVDYSSELKMKPWWAVIGSLPGPGQIVAGASLAKRYNLTTGSTLLIQGRPYKVSGVMQETGGSEDNAVFTGIDFARALTGNNNSWTIIELNSRQPDAALAQLTKQLPSAKVAEISQLVEGSRETVSRFNNYAFLASLLLGLVAILIVAITTAANVNSRISELGIFRAIGFRRHHILGLLLREMIILSLCGGIIGYGLGLSVPLLFGPIIFQKVFPFHLFPILAFKTMGVFLLTACLTMALPAWRAIRLDPAEALRHI